MTVTRTTSPSGRYVIPSIPVRRFSVGEYLRLVEEGFFASDERFELLDGLITPKMSRNPPHDAALNRIRRRLEQVLKPGWVLRVQSALQTSDSVPEPDIAVVRGDDADYEARHPGPDDTALVVEIANTSVADDLGYKLSVYARAGIRCYWVVDLNASSIEICGDPGGEGAAARYLQRTTCHIGDILPPVPSALPSIHVEELLRRRQASNS